jgi:hypothetical protein
VRGVAQRLHGARVCFEDFVPSGPPVAVVLVEPARNTAKPLSVDRPISLISGGAGPWVLSAQENVTGLDQHPSNSGQIVGIDLETLGPSTAYPGMIHAGTGMTAERST